MKRYVYLGCALLLALITAVMVLRSQHTVPVVFATHDLAAGAQVHGEDLELRYVHEDGAPAGAVTSPELASGRYTALPLTAGEPVLDRALSDRRSGHSISHDFQIPSGDVAIAVPVQPAGAVGGMLQPGDHVDVYATPLAGHQSGSSSAGAGPAAADAQVLGHDVLVLELRSDQGQAMQSADSSSTGNVHGLNFGGGKLGSVVLAVPAADVAHYAQAATADSIYLALSVG
jgi:Flp pilus assembly protein CpaB